MQIAKHCLVKGRVQGVFFRQGTLEKAIQLGITGWVSNLPDGAVECVICGEQVAVEKMCEWLRKGPPAAKVMDLQIEDVAWEEYKSFSILR